MMFAKAVNFALVRILGRQISERIYLVLGRVPFLRKLLRIGALTIQYTENVPGDPLRLAQMKGYRAFVDIREFSGMHAYFFGEFSIPWFVPSLLKNPVCLIDIGANMGHWSLLAATMNRSSRVYTFEPHPRFAHLIQKSAAENRLSNLKVIQLAASDSSDQWVEFYPATDPRNSGTSSLVFHGVGLSQGTKIQVKTIRVDEYWKKENLGDIDLVKIDVERAEAKVIGGLSALLAEKKIKFLVVEMVSGSPLKIELEKYGYHCIGVINWSRDVFDFAPENLDESVCHDYVFERSRGLITQFLT